MDSSSKLCQSRRKAKQLNNSEKGRICTLKPSILCNSRGIQRNFECMPLDSSTNECNPLKQCSGRKLEARLLPYFGIKMAAKYVDIVEGDGFILCKNEELHCIKELLRDISEVGGGITPDQLPVKAQNVNDYLSDLQPEIPDETKKDHWNAMVNRGNVNASSKQFHRQPEATSVPKDFELKEDEFNSKRREEIILNCTDLFPYSYDDNLNFPQYMTPPPGFDLGVSHLAETALPTYTGAASSTGGTTPMFEDEFIAEISPEGDTDNLLEYYKLVDFWVIYPGTEAYEAVAKVSHFIGGRGIVPYYRESSDGLWTHDIEYSVEGSQQLTVDVQHSPEILMVESLQEFQQSGSAGLKSAPNPWKFKPPSDPWKSGPPSDPWKSGPPSSPWKSGPPPDPWKSGPPPDPWKSGPPSDPWNSESPSDPWKSGPPSDPWKSGTPSDPQKSGPSSELQKLKPLPDYEEIPDPEAINNAESEEHICSGEYSIVSLEELGDGDEGSTDAEQWCSSAAASASPTGSQASRHLSGGYTSSSSKVISLNSSSFRAAVFAIVSLVAILYCSSSLAAQPTIPSLQSGLEQAWCEWTLPDKVSQPTGGMLDTKDHNKLQCALSDGDDTSIEDWCIDGTKPEKVCNTVDPTKYYDLYLEMPTLISYQVLVPTKHTRGNDEFVGYSMKHGKSSAIESIDKDFETTQYQAVELIQLSEGKHCTQYKSTLACILLARNAEIQQPVTQELVIQHVLEHSAPADRASKQDVMSQWIDEHTAQFSANKQMRIARNDGEDETLLLEIRKKELSVETERDHVKKHKIMGFITSPVDIEITRCGNKHRCLKSSNDRGNDTDSDTRERTKQTENGGTTASNEAGSSDHVPSSASGAEGSSGGDGDDGGSDKKFNCRTDDDDNPVANEHKAAPLVVAVPKANNSEGSRNLICFQQFESWERPEETFAHMIRTTLQLGIVQNPPQGIPSSTSLGELPMLQNTSSNIRANRLRHVDPELAEMFQRLNELDEPDEWNNQPSMDTTNQQTPPYTYYGQDPPDGPLVPDAEATATLNSSTTLFDTVPAVTTFAVEEEFQYLIFPVQPTEEQITAVAVQEEIQYSDQRDPVTADALPEMAEGAHEEDEVVDGNMPESAEELLLTALNEHEEGGCFDVGQAQAEDLPVVAESAGEDYPYVGETESYLLRRLVVVTIGVQEKDPDVEEESQPLRPEIIQHPVEN